MKSLKMKLTILVIMKIATKSVLLITLNQSWYVGIWKSLFQFPIPLPRCLHDFDQAVFSRVEGYTVMKEGQDTNVQGSTNKNPQAKGGFCTKLLDYSFLIMHIKLFTNESL